MTTTKFKLESGIQLLSRLTKKPDVENIHPVLFEDGPKHGEVIEVFGPGSTANLLFDIISEALIPGELDGLKTGIIIFNTNGNLEIDLLVNTIRKKLLQRVNSDITYVDQIVHKILQKLYILEIYDATQFYTSIYNLENILADHPDISLVLFDTITAFYWSEQGFKITKMDSYIKSILRIVQKVTKEYKILILYTRPEYFNSSKDALENMESCCENPTLERVNYRIHLAATADGIWPRFHSSQISSSSHSSPYSSQIIWEVNVRSSTKLYKKQFSVHCDEIKWL